jgi:multiple antibiotic resistance protein
MIEFSEVLLVTFTSLFPVLNPIGCAPIFLSFTQHYPQSVRRVLARKIAVYSFALLSVSLLFGTEILGFFGISLAVIQISGGLLVSATGWRLLNQESAAPARQESSAALGDALAQAFFPLTLPITVGPGCIGIAITIGANLRREVGEGMMSGIPRRFTAALLGMLLLCVVVTVCYTRAEQMARRLGSSGTNILVRLSAFILFAIGVQIVWNGLRLGLPQLLMAPATH